MNQHIQEYVDGVGILTAQSEKQPSWFSWGAKWHPAFALSTLLENIQAMRAISPEDKASVEEGAILLYDRIIVPALESYIPKAVWIVVRRFVDRLFKEFIIPGAVNYIFSTQVPATTQR